MKTIYMCKCISIKKNIILNEAARKHGGGVEFAQQKN